MIEPLFTNNYDDTYTVSNQCMCGTIVSATVPGPAVFAWRRGACAQNAFSMLSVDEREALFISGICAECWDSMFPDDEDM